MDFHNARWFAKRLKSWWASMNTTKSSKTRRTIHQLFVGRLVAENGQIKLLRESINLFELPLAIYPNGLADYKVLGERQSV